MENVFVWNNTSVIVDEVLGHRLGLVPMNVDPSLIEMKEADGESPGLVSSSVTRFIILTFVSDEVATDRNTIVFRLNVACTRNLQAALDETDPEKLYNHANGKKFFLSTLVPDDNVDASLHAGSSMGTARRTDVDI